MTSLTKVLTEAAVQLILRNTCSEISAAPQDRDERKPVQIHTTTYTDTASSPLLIGLQRARLGYLRCRVPASRQFRNRPLKNDFNERLSKNRKFIP